VNHHTNVLVTVLLLAVSLSMDAFAISVSNGLALTRVRIRHAFRLAFAFGFAQAVMPAIGFLAAASLKTFITSWDHWIAFVLLAIVGGKMICESFMIRKAERVIEATCPEAGCADVEAEVAASPALRSARTLVVLAVATSIDALAVGITLPLLNVGIVLPAAIIGAVTFVICFVGVYIGKTVGHFFEAWAEIVAGVILIGIGTKILVEHLVS